MVAEEIHGPPIYDMQDVWTRIECPEVFRYLVTKYQAMSVRQVLLSCIELGHEKIVQYVLCSEEITHICASKLLCAAAMRSLPIFELALHHVNTDITRNLLIVVRKTCSSLSERSLSKLVLNTQSLGLHITHHRESEAMTCALMKDERVRTRDLSIALLRVFTYSLSWSIEDGINGFLLGSELAGQATCRETLGKIIEGSSIYSLVTRYILLKRPDASQLAAWITDMNNVYLHAAVSSLLDKNSILSTLDPRIMSFRILLRVMLEQSTTLQRVIDKLRHKRVTEEAIILSARLVGLYLGESRINR
jgi:hypothetical protein